MCESCMVEDSPDRNRMCLDTGAYLLNFKSCICGSSNLVISDKTQKEEEDGSEVVTYDHVCGDCRHLISKHHYEFKIVGDYQEFSMECSLCGNGEDTASIMPNDPRLIHNGF